MADVELYTPAYDYYYEYYNVLGNNINMSLNETCLLVQDDNVHKFSDILLLPTSCLAIIINLLIILIMYFNRQRLIVFDIIVVAVCLNGIGLSVSFLLHSAVDSHDEENLVAGDYHLPLPYCQFMLFYSYFTQFCTLLLMVMISVVRFLMVVFPKRKDLYSVGCGLIGISLVCIVAALLSIPFLLDPAWSEDLFGSWRCSRTSLTVEDVGRMNTKIMVLILSIIVCPLLMVIFYALVIYFLNKTKLRTTRAAVLIYLLLLMFFLLYYPAMVVETVLLMVYYFIVMVHCDTLRFLVHVFTVSKVFMGLFCMLSPLLYVAGSTTFKQKFMVAARHFIRRLRIQRP